MHINVIPIRHEDTNSEIIARIFKAASHKYDCDVEIDFHSDTRKVVFLGDETMKTHIAGEVLDIFEPAEGDSCSSN